MNLPHLRRGGIILLALCLLQLLPTVASAQRRSSRATTPDDNSAALAIEHQLLKATSKVEGYYLRDLAKVAALTISRGLPDEAEKIVARMARIDPEYALLEKLRAALEKSRANPPAEPPDEKKTETLRRTISKRLDDVSESHARRLFDLAKKCMRLGLFTRAYGLVKAVLDADPDHKSARKVLSYEWDRTGKTWISKWEYRMRRTHYVTDEGWVKKTDKKKWDKGLRPYRGKWIASDEEARLRKRNPYNAFSAETEHFVVRSNLGRQKAFEFALRLEDFYRVFFELFVGFYDQKAGATLLFNTAPIQKKHEVMVFPSRVEYLDFVRNEKGNNELLVRSAGFWSAGDQKSFFYWTTSSDDTVYTCYHETTHQLFGETTDGLGRSTGNIWVVEGIANYMEFLEKVKDKWRPGYRIDAPSLKGVQAFLARNSDWRLASYISLGHKDFHEKESRGLHYALGGALSHFFLHYEGGIYQEDYIRLLRAFYDGNLKAGSLPEYIRVEGATTSQQTLARIEEEFRGYMKNLVRPGEAADTTEEVGAGAASGGS